MRWQVTVCGNRWAAGIRYRFTALRAIIALLRRRAWGGRSDLSFVSLIMTPTMPVA